MCFAPHSHFLEGIKTIELFKSVKIEFKYCHENDAPPEGITCSNSTEIEDFFANIKVLSAVYSFNFIDFESQSDYFKRSASVVELVELIPGKEFEAKVPLMIH